MKNDLTQGSMFQALLKFSLPYLLSSFLQTFYGMVDLYVIGQYHSADTISAVAIGSQMMHVITVVIVGLAMGSTVTIGLAVGSKKPKEAAGTIGNTAVLFLSASLVLTAVLMAASGWIVEALSTPAGAAGQARLYLRICFLGIPVITAYNVISCIFRGLGDSKSPLYFVGVACVLNIALDYLFIGAFGLGAAGAALGTVASQTVSVLSALWMIKKRDLGIPLGRGDFHPRRCFLGAILKVGIPVAFQDGLIQISFLIITMIANRRGLVISASVGIVEKIIGFLFLVPSSMLSSVSAIAAQNVGAGEYGQARAALKYGIGVSVAFGLAVGAICQFAAEPFVGLFSRDPAVMVMGGQYLRAYVWDCLLAGIHFCLSGYFCAIGRSGISFVHNFLSILLFRIPGAYLASVYFPDNLYPMGLAPAAGSAFSALVCIGVYRALLRRGNNSFKIRETMVK